MYTSATRSKSSVFVKLTGDDQIQTAGAGDKTIGIMHESTWATPIPGADADVAVISGQSKRVYGEDEVCEVRIADAGALAAGALIGPDANGEAVAVATGEYAAIVLSGGAAGERAKVVVTRGSAD